MGNMTETVRILTFAWRPEFFFKFLELQLTRKNHNVTQYHPQIKTCLLLY